MTQIEVISLFWTLMGVLMLVGVILAAIRMGLDEQRERQKAADDLEREEEEQ